ncbi:MAG: hypothetical protein QXE81_06020, partial [Desulfurococcaceae archaeon]
MKINGVIPGSREEREAVDAIKIEMKDTMDSVKTLDIPVYEWSWSCQFESKELVSQCILLPYSHMRSIEINPSEIINVKDIDKILKQGSNLYEKVVMAR